MIMEKTYCPYCHPTDPTPLNVETIKYSGLEMTLLRNGSNAFRVRHFSDDDCEIFDCQDVVLIRFCPMCGRNLYLRKER